MAQAPITVTGLTGGYSGTPVIHNCNMQIASGEIVVIMGGSGSGKSTFLRHLIGLKEPMQGDVLLFGESLVRCSVIILPIFINRHIESFFLERLLFSYPLFLFFKG